MGTSPVFEAAASALTQRGWTRDELAPLFESLEVNTVIEGATVLVKGRTIDFVVFVFSGSVAHGGRALVAGDVLGASHAISGHPLVDDAVVESTDAVLGALPMKKLEGLGGNYPGLAVKVLKMLSVLALGGEFDARDAPGTVGKGGAGAKPPASPSKTPSFKGSPAKPQPRTPRSPGGESASSPEILFQQPPRRRQDEAVSGGGGGDETVESM